MPRHEPEMLSAAHAASVRRRVLPLTDQLVTQCLSSGHDAVSQAVAAGLAASMIAAAHFPEDRVLAVVERVCDMMLQTTRTALEKLAAQGGGNPPAPTGDAP